MAIVETCGVQIEGLASAIPERTVRFEDDAQRFGAQETEKLRQSTGVHSRHVVPDGVCTSDLCFSAAEKLLDELNWERGSIDLLVVITQTPDHIMPATSCSLHHRLGLAKTCAAFDVNLGCSGYVYGLSVVSQFLSGGGMKRALLLVGDTMSRIVSPLDRSAAPLFGDAGTATALQHDPAAPPMVFDLRTDGAGHDHLIVPAGSFRNPRSPQTSERTERERGNVRSEEDLFMNGAEVFMFTLCEVPGLVQSTLQAANWTTDDVDGVVMHQANAFMLQHLARRMKIPQDKLPLALNEYGNTSSASIPLAITHHWSGKDVDRPLQFLLAGFGVGWSWGAAAVTCASVTLPPLVVLPDKVADATERKAA